MVLPINKFVVHLLPIEQQVSNDESAECVGSFGGKMMRSNQQEWGTNSVFSQVYTLYTSCKERGSWARLVLETDSNGEETVTFSVKETSHSNPAPSTSYHPPPARRGGRKTPSKARKDKVKWRAWLERKLEESREEVPSLPKPVSSADPPAPCPSYASCVFLVELKPALRQPVRYPLLLN